MKLKSNFDYFVGIDYSIRSPGICIFDHSNYGDFGVEYCKLHYVTYTKSRIVECDFIKPLFLDEWKSRTDQYKQLAEWAISIIPPSSFVLIEDYSYASQGANFNVGENTGILKLYLEKNDIEYDVADLTGPKKMATGTGNATKEMMEETFVKNTGIDLQTIFKVNTLKDKSPVYDLVDAYFLSEYAFCTKETSYLK